MQCLIFIGKCKLFVWLKLGSQKDNSSEFFKDIGERSIIVLYIMFILVHSPFARKKSQEPKLQYKGGFCLWYLITASKVWHAYMAKCWDYYGFFKCYCPLTFTVKLSLIPASFSFLHLYFFLPKFRKIIFKKVQVATGSGTGFSSEFSGQVNFTWFTWLCSFFISFMVWSISLTPSAKLSVTIQQYKGGGSTRVAMYSSCVNGLNEVATKQDCVYT